MKTRFLDLCEAMNSKLKVQLNKLRKHELIYIVNAWNNSCSQGEWDRFHDLYLLSDKRVSVLSTKDVSIYLLRKAIEEFDMFNIEILDSPDEQIIPHLLKLLKQSGTDEDEGDDTSAGVVLIFLDMLEKLGKTGPEFETIKKAAEGLPH